MMGPTCYRCGAPLPIDWPARDTHRCEPKPRPTIQFRAVYQHPSTTAPGMYGPWRDTIEEAADDRNRVGGVGIDHPRHIEH